MVTATNSKSEIQKGCGPIIVVGCLTRSRRNQQPGGADGDRDSASPTSPQSTTGQSAGSEALKRKAKDRLRARALQWLAAIGPNFAPETYVSALKRLGLLPQRDIAVYRYSDTIILTSL